MPLDRLCNMVHAWHLRRLLDHVNTCALAGDKQGHAAASAELQQFRQLLEGDPRYESEEALRAKWGSTPDAEQGTRAMQALPGVHGFYLDDDTGIPGRVDNPGETPLQQAYHDLNDVERAAGIAPTPPPMPWDGPAGQAP